MKKKDLVIRRAAHREVALFVDGVALDRAARRIGRRIDFPGLLASLSLGTTPSLARYYTVVPLEDDSRHRSFLDAVERAGFSAIVKRLPPKGVDRQVTTDVEMTADLVAFSVEDKTAGAVAPSAEDKKLEKIAVLVCPTRDLSYPIAVAKDMGVATVVADFGAEDRRDTLKGAKDFINLTDSEKIWIPS